MTAHIYKRRSSWTGVSYRNRQSRRSLASCNHLRRSPAVYVRLIEYHISSHVRRTGGQHLLLAVNQITGIECRQLEPVSMGNSVGGASLNAVSAKNAAVVIDVVNL